ncbi:MAG: spore coat U domain-containing protein [Methylophilaceae bacterium]|nr:spore coat U domain-containing protein [Methyloradius sp.]
MRNSCFLVRCLVLLAGLAFFSDAQADATCLATSIGPIIIYDPVDSAPRPGLGSISVTCTNIGLGTVGVAYQIQLSQGISNNYLARNMRFLVTNSLVYNLYTDPAYSIIWGNGSSGTAMVSDSYSMGTGVVLKSYPVYVQIPARQAVVAGIYLDSITATITY